jgi:hypothetical protein
MQTEDNCKGPRLINRPQQKESSLPEHDRSSHPPQEWLDVPMDRLTKMHFLAFHTRSTGMPASCDVGSSSAAEFTTSFEPVR